MAGDWFALAAHRLLIPELPDAVVAFAETVCSNGCSASATVANSNNASNTRLAGFRYSPYRNSFLFADPESRTIVRLLLYRDLSKADLKI